MNFVAGGRSLERQGRCAVELGSGLHDLLVQYPASTAQLWQGLSK